MREEDFDGPEVRVLGVGVERVEMVRNHRRVLMQIVEALTVALVEKYSD